MVKILEDILEQKAKNNQSEILFAQWNYDRKIIPAALQAISSLFPHFSLHDESHSISIINNILRILGKENIVKLSAIDIWLILEAAYCHDIGMVVAGDELSETLTSSGFLEFFKEILSDTKNGLYEFAKQFRVVNGHIDIVNSEFNLQLTDGIKFILAEYFRRLHADRSEEIINNPVYELSILSPRGIIPPRIFKILGSICAAHTKSFESVMKLSFSEVGIDTENAHPRFVACLLRIGDLLDLDNNRFSEVMLRTLTKIPIDTLTHKLKHLSIESFRVDRDVIDITAKCKDYDTANITQHWFNYLNGEISSQMIAWNTIVPSKEFGYLPTIGSLKVELINYEYIDGKNKPKFSVNADKALGLLQGAGLYNGAYQCIREILQNAVDATLMRIWIEHGETEIFSAPNTGNFSELIKQYSISLKIYETGIVDGFKSWNIEVEDKGIGISTYDLQFLMNTGSSSNNRKKQAIIDRMPAWMRPSGTFGIGFQSVFMLTDQVNINTKSFFTEEYQAIELNGPNSKKDGDILIQKKATNYRIKPGTKISFTYRTKAIPDGFTIKGEHLNASKIAENFDPFTHSSLDIELGKIFDETFAFSNKSYIPVSLEIDSKKIESYAHTSATFKYYDEKTCLEFNFFDGDMVTRSRITTYFKNQHADNGFSFLFVGFEVNIHNEKASEVLTLNRNKIKDDFKTKLFKQILYASFRIITEYFDDIFITQEAKQKGSMFLHFYFPNINKKGEFDILKFNQWEELEIVVSGEKITLKELLKSFDVLKIINDYRMQSKKYDIYELHQRALTITFTPGGPMFSSTSFFIFKVKEMIKSISNIIKHDKNITEIWYSTITENNGISKDYLKEILVSIKDKGSGSARFFIPCIIEYSKLRIKNEAFEPYVYSHVIDYSLNLPYPKILSPFIVQQIEENKYIFKTVLNEQVYDWVYNNRYNGNVTRNEIVETYTEFCRQMDINLV